MVSMASNTVFGRGIAKNIRVLGTCFLEMNLDAPYFLKNVGTKLTLRAFACERKWGKVG